MFVLFTKIYVLISQENLTCHFEEENEDVPIDRKNYSHLVFGSQQGAIYGMFKI